MKHGFTKRLVRKLAILFAALLAIFVLFILEENLRGRIMLARYKAELRAKGEKLTLAELNFVPPLEEGSGNAELAAAGRELNALEGADRFSVWSLTRLRWTRPGRVIVRCRQPDLHVRKRQLAGKQGHANPFRLEMEYASWADLGEQVSAASNALARARAACQNLLEMSPFLTR